MERITKMIRAMHETTARVMSVHTTDLPFKLVTISKNMKTSKKQHEKKHFN